MPQCKVKVLTNLGTCYIMRLERIETMNKKNVLPHAGGGGAPHIR